MYRHIAATGTYRIAGTNGVDTEVTLGSLIINKPLANGVITIYDQSSDTPNSANIVAQINYPGTLLNDAPNSVDFNVKLTKGLLIVVGTANLDITVTFS